MYNREGAGRSVFFGGDRVCYVRRWGGGNNSVVECDLAKVEVAGSNPVSRSNLRSQREVAHAAVSTRGGTRPREGCPPSGSREGD